MSARIPPSESTRTRRGVSLVSGGLRIGERTVPLYAGSVHYWRLAPRDWRACLEAVKGLGLHLVDVYIPWAVHEVAPGVLELGDKDPTRDVGGFLRLAHELGLYAIVRPGPHINGELTHFGIPERVVWDPACQARSPQQAPVVLPMVPMAFPVPSYASEAFHDEAARYFRGLGPCLAPLLYPDGPIVMLQIDNEGALYFRDGAYDQDYHPDAVTLYRAFLRDKYGTIEELVSAYAGEVGADGEPEALRFATIEPPTRFDAQSVGGLARHLDWSEFHEQLLATALGRFGDALVSAGLDGIPTTHNFPLGQEATPLNAARVSREIDLVGLDYYHQAGEAARAVIARRTTELAVRTEAVGKPAFACEMGAGFPPFFPPLEERDSMFGVMTALAYGLRGFNVYMAVERDRWIGAPIDPRGRPRAFATFWRKLTAALETSRFHELRRPTPVRLLTPRNERRLTRVMHAFGPVTPAFFSVLGAGARERCLEDDLGLGYAPAIELDAFLRALEQALDARGVSYGHIGGEDRDVSLEGARWVVCATSGGLSPKLFATLEEAAHQGTHVTIGPRRPEYGGARRPLPSPLDLDRLGARAGSAIPVLLESGPGPADAVVAAAISELGLETHACDPDWIHATVHQDDEGRPRVLFVINSSSASTTAQVTVGAGVRRAVDLFDESSHELDAQTLEIVVPGKAVRMFALEA